MVEKTVDKIARLCWNNHYWRQPSGRLGKSNNKKSFEFENEFGYEEWLFDTGKTINGYHYGFLEQVKEKHRNNKFDIYFYSINNMTKEILGIGFIKNVQIISCEESNKIHTTYKENGWIEEMKYQLIQIGLNSQLINQLDPELFVNIKYKPRDLEIYEPPKKIQNIKDFIRSYHYRFQEKTRDPEFESMPIFKLNFKPGHIQKKLSATSISKKLNYVRNTIHDMMINKIFLQLKQKYGNNNVGTEQHLYYGAQVDICVKNNDKYIFYEIKTSSNIQIVIREALSQLLEYAYWPNIERAEKLIIVSKCRINEDTKNYLKKLRNEFKINVFYQEYNEQTNQLNEEEY